MFPMKDSDMTKYLLQFCYTCPGAADCVSEQMCAACREASVIGEEQDEGWEAVEGEVDETKELLRLYAL